MTSDGSLPSLPPHPAEVRDFIVSKYSGRRVYGGEDGLQWEEYLGQFMDDLDVFRRIALDLIRANCMNELGAMELMEEAWATNITPEAVIPAAHWIDAFRAAGYLTNVEDSRPCPTEALTLFRGTERRYRCGLAWTDSLDVAEDFARQAGESGVVFSAEVAPDQVLARYNTARSEREYVVDTNGLVVVIFGADDDLPLAPCVLR
jgi:hypothetical protein